VGRGLSDFQKLILTWAFQDCDSRHFFSVTDLIQVCHEGDFTRAAVGAEAYDAEHASFSKILGRLESRGLIRLYKGKTGGGTIVLLTASGEATARQLIEQDKEQVG
jgi:hypothetical protein